MTYRRVISAIAVGAALVLVACVLAQAPRNPANKNSRPAAPSGTTTPYPLTDAAPAPTPYSPSNPYPVQQAYESRVPGSLAAPPIPGTPVASLPARLQLTSGTTIEGQVPAEQLQGQTTFGEVSIPLDKVRGLRLLDPDASAGEQRRPAQTAAVIFTNGDSLTVTLRAELIQVKTEWGMAIVDVPHVRSLILTTDEVQWQEAAGRWILAPVEKAPAEAADSPAGTTSARTFIQEEDEAKLGIELQP